MTKTYLNNLLDAFDQEFESLVIPFPEENVYHQVNVAENYSLIDNGSEIEAEEKLQKIENLASQISTQRYTPNYNPEVCLANLLNVILSKDIDETLQNDFFQLLNQERNTNLTEALNDFDFFLDNPYRKKAEKILAKFEGYKNK